MVSSVRAGMIAQEKEKKRQTRLAEQGIVTSPEVVMKAVVKQNPLEVLEVIADVVPKAKQSTKENKPKKKSKAKKQSKNNNKVLKDS
tara:strand:- start:149 stop:409 length:261 start_codon:yes stop_codon:yes gene_type:complete